jgi:hypothetical protein
LSVVCGLTITTFHASGLPTLAPPTLEFRMNRLLQSCSIAVLALGASSALAQLVTPPSQAPAPTEPYKIPERPPTPPPASPMDAKGAPDIQPPIPQPKVVEPLPDLPYESLVKKDGDKLILLQKPVDQAALEVNPTIKDDATKAKIAEYLADRRARFENVIIENVDLAEKLYNGAMDNIDFTDRKQIGEFNSMVKPLTPPVAPANMGAELTKRGVVTDLQKRFNDKIAKEYNDARNKALREGNVAGEDKNANAKNIIRIYMQQVIEEQMMIYESLMVETSKGLAKTLPQIGLDTQAAAKAMDALKSIKGSANADIGRGMKDVMAGLTLDQKKALLRKTVEARAK